MAITNHLLPIGSNSIWKNACGRNSKKSAVENPIVIADLINPERCPTELLPYLAWAFSVDKGMKTGQEVKRIAVKQSYFVHKHKGAIGAVKRVVASIGYLIELKNGFKQILRHTRNI